MKWIGFVLFFPLVVTAQTIKLGDIAVTPRKLTTFDAPLSPALQGEAAKGGNPTITAAKCAISVPDGFDPSKSWPTAVVSAADDSTNIRLMNYFVGPGAEKGWVIVAADPPEKAKQETTEWRYALVAAAFDLMEKAWPGAKKWPVACCGFSGGAKRSAYMAAIMMKSGYTINGMLMSGCNEDRTAEATKDYHPGARYKDVPVFLCGGSKDNIATPAQHAAVQASLKRNGFRNVRLETFEGGHQPSSAEIAVALDWFKETASKTPRSDGNPSSGTTGSSFDDFFKKK